MKRVKIYNGRVITPYRLIDNGSVVVEDGIISRVCEKDIEEKDCFEIDAGGCYVSPGFIDIHVHGGGGHDFMDGTVEAYLGAVEKHAIHGTTSIVPTTLTSTQEEMNNTFRVFREAKKRNINGAAMIGLHLEGPYFAMSQKG